MHPPAVEGGPARVEVTHQTHFHDPYNWHPTDRDKIVSLGPIDVPRTDDPTLAEFHRAGTAQQYDARGSSAPVTETREIR